MSEPHGDREAVTLSSPTGLFERLRSPVHTVVDQLGGRRRTRLIVLLAGTVALDSADKGAIGAIAVPLKQSLDLGNASFGLVATAVSIAGAVATLPVGVLTDRMARTRLLGMSLVLWVAAMLASGASTSFVWLIASRIGLAGVTATAGPAVASLVGDLFLRVERARIYGFVLAGELVGTGFGIVVAGEVAAVASWRFALWILALPAAWLAWELLRTPEPARGGAGRLLPEPGTTAAEEVAMRNGTVERADDATAPGDPVMSDRAACRGTAGAGTADGDTLEGGTTVDVAADPPADGHPVSSLWHAARYVLSVRTNVILIVASTVGYFFFTGIRTFAFVYVRGEYHLNQATVTALVPVVGAGALIGVLVAGRLADRLVRRGVPAARVTVAAACPALTVAALLPAVFVPAVALALPLFVVAAFTIGAANPPIDAARLDVIEHRVWGRAEAIRTLLRTGGEALAPVLFGVLSHHLAGGGTAGLRLTFAVMLVPLLASGAILLLARRTYPTDAAHAAQRRGAAPSPGGHEAAAAG